MTRQTIGLLLGLAVAAPAAAQTQNWIYQHNSNLHEESNYTITQPLKGVEIHLGEAGETFEFEARTREWDGDEWVDIGPGVIDRIIVDEDAGPVEITIVGSLGHDYGASNIEEIALTATGTTANIAGLKVSQDVGSIIAYAVTGEVSVGGALGDVEITQLAGDISCNSMGDLTVLGASVPGPLSHSGGI